jgi:hypothetical protein
VPVENLEVQYASLQPRPGEEESCVFGQYISNIVSSLG